MPRKNNSKHDSSQNYEVQLNMKAAILVLIIRALKIRLNRPKVRNSPGYLVNPNPLFNHCYFDKNVKSWIDSVNEFETIAFEQGCSPRQVLVFIMLDCVGSIKDKINGMRVSPNPNLNTPRSLVFMYTTSAYTILNLQLKRLVHKREGQEC